MKYERIIYYVDGTTKQDTVSAEYLIGVMSRILAFKDTDVRDWYSWSTLSDERGDHGYKLIMGDPSGSQYIIHTYRPIAE